MQPYKLKILSPATKLYDGRVVFENPQIELEIGGQPVDVGLLSELSLTISATNMVPQLTLKLIPPPGSEITFEGGAEVVQEVTDDPCPWNLLGVRRYTGKALRQIRETPKSPKTTPPDEYSLLPHKPDIFGRRPLDVAEFRQRLEEAGIQIPSPTPPLLPEDISRIVQEVIQEQLQKHPTQPGVMPDVRNIALDVFQLKKMLVTYFDRANLPVPPEIRREVQEAPVKQAGLPLD